MLSKIPINLLTKFGFLILVSIAIWFLQIQSLQKIKSQNESLTKEQLTILEKSDKTQLNIIKKFPSFGFNNLIADWGFLEFIQYFGDTPVREKVGYSLIPDYFEIVVDRDPRFVEAYSYLSPSNTIYAGRPDISVALLKQAVKYISPQFSPTSYLVWSYKGVDELLFLGDAKAAQNSYKTAAKWASLQSSPEIKQIGKYLDETAQFLQSNPDSKQAQASSWAMILHNTQDPITRQIAIDRIQVLGGKVKITEQGELKVSLPKK